MHWTDILSKEFPDSLITEYYKAFGRENTKKFIDIFGGMTFDIPRWSQIRRAIKKHKRSSDNGTEIDSV